MIKSDEVTDLFLDCLFKEGEDQREGIIVHGICANYMFNPIRLGEHEKRISEIIDMLPEGFKGGWSFLNICYDKNDNQWTGQHSVCEQLVVMGLAIEKFRYVLPREMWGAFPSSMPYIQIVEDDS